jgi:tetratricopeptide (TPR) repeat protein
MRNGLAVISLVVVAALPTSAQKTSPQLGPRQISGQVRLDQKVAPQGVLLLLDVAPNQSMAPAGAGSVVQTMTDSSGKFFFDHLETVGTRQGREFFAVTARYPGYRDAFQVVDLTVSPHGYAVLELHRDTSRDMPNVPPSGPGGSISASQPSSQEAKDALAKGQQLLLEKHDAKSSIEIFKKVVKLDPKYTPGYFLLGTACVQTHQWAEALSAFEKASNLEPSNAAAFYGIGYTRNQQQDFSGAQKPLQHSLQLDPNSAEANYELGRSLWAIGKWQDAEPHARAAIALNKDSAPPHILMGNIYLRRHDANSALSEFQEYLRLDPEGPYAEAAKQMVAKIQNALGRR